MKTEIKVNITDNMTVKQRDAIINSPYTINLTWEVTSKQRRKNRVINRRKHKLIENAPKILTVITVSLAIIATIAIANANNYTMVAQDNKEYFKNDLNEFHKPSWNLCQNLAFSNPERFKKECDVEKVNKTINEVKRWTYKTVEEKAFEFIIQFEWYHDKPYFDHKGYSCWYGMRCSKNTTWITKEKSKFFVIERIKQIRTKYNLEKYDDDIEVALISFIYNIWHPPIWMNWYIENWYINWLKNMMRKYSYASWKHLRWLAKRRNAETNLF